MTSTILEDTTITIKPECKKVISDMKRNLHKMCKSLIKGQTLTIKIGLSKDKLTSVEKSVCSAELRELFSYSKSEMGEALHIEFEETLDCFTAHIEPVFSEQPAASTN